MYVHYEKNGANLWKSIKSLICIAIASEYKRREFKACMSEEKQDNGRLIWTVVLHIYTPDASQVTT